MSPTFSSLSVRNYRIYASGSLVSNVGTWMGRVGQDWLVLTQLTDHSSSALGIVTGLQFLPFLILAPHFAPALLVGFLLAGGRRVHASGRQFHRQGHHIDSSLRNRADDTAGEAQWHDQEDCSFHPPNVADVR